MSIFGHPKTKVPRSIRTRMVQAGAEKDVGRGENLSLIRINDGTSSAPWRLYEDWVCGLGEVDALVYAAFNPPSVLLETALVPDSTLLVGLLLEVHSLCQHHAPLLMSAFAGGPPVIPGPLVFVQIPIRLHHAKVAVTSLISAIQDPPAAYPIINSLGAGSYICSLRYLWTGTIMIVHVFKTA